MGLTLFHSRNVLATETSWQTMIPQVLTTHGDQNMEASLDMTIEELASQILLSRHLTREQQRNLMVVRHNTHLLMDEEKTLVERVLYGVRHGLLTVIES